MARMIIAGGGISGCLVGTVGNGSEEAVADLSTDIVLGTPAGLGACFTSWTLPAALARLCLHVLRVLSACYASSALVKRWVKRAVQWMCDDFYREWRRGAGADAFEA
eukprot:7321557-Prymnesium_polylepis.1